jgi:hypothetical protein
MNIIRIFINLFRFDRANWKAVVLCILTAIVFWIFNAFNKNYSTNIRFPLLFEFDGEKFAPAEHLPKTLILNVSGNGWELFRKHLGVKVPPLIILLERPNEVKKIIGSTLAPMLATQVGNLKINYVVTDTLHVQIDLLDSHRYKLAADISGITFREGYGRISPVVVLPDSVKLNGPQAWLHALTDSVSLTVNEKNVSGNFREEVEIGFPGSDFVKRDPPVAQVIFEVGRVMEVNKRLKVVIDKNRIGTVNVPDSINALFQIPINRVEDFNKQANDIFSKADAKYLKKNKVMVPSVFNVPSFAQLLHVDSVHTLER